MMAKTVLAAIATVMLCGSAPAGFVIAAPLLGVTENLSPIQNAAFVGRPFPYRYTWSRARACTRYEPTETARGVRWQRIWVCGDPKSRRYRDWN